MPTRESKNNKDIDFKDPINIDVTDYLKKAGTLVKDTISNISNKIEIPSIPVNYNIFDRVRSLESKIDNIEIWRNDNVDPNILKIFNDIKNIAADINKAVDTAITAKDFAKAFILKLALAGDLINYGVKDMTYSAQGIHNTLTEEIINISNSFVRYGTTLMDKSRVVGDRAISLGKEMASSAQEILIPLGYCVDEAEDAADELGTAWDKLDDWDIESVVKYAIKGAKSLKNSMEVLVYKPYGGQNSVLLELHEAIQSIGYEGKQLGNALFDFGNYTYSGAEILGREISNAINKVKREMDFFTNTYKRVFNDLYLVFTEDLSNEEIVVEIEKKKKERDKFFAFMSDLSDYETTSISCKEAQYNRVVYKEMLEKASEDLQNAKEDIISWKEKYDELIAKFPNKYGFSLNTVIARARKSPVWVPQYDSNGTRLSISPYIYNKYYKDYLKDVVFFNGVEYLKIPDYFPFDTGKKKIKISMTGTTIDEVLAGAEYHIEYEYAEVVIWQYTNIEYMNYTVTPNRYTVIDTALNVNRAFWEIDRALFKHYEAQDTVKKEEAKLVPYQEEYDKAIAVAEATCNIVSAKYEAFRNKWSLTPEEGDKLTYEDIINLNV